VLARRSLTVKDASDLIQVGEATVRQWIKQGELIAVVVGREWRIAPRNLQQFILRRSRRTGSASAQDVAGGDK